MSPLDVLLLSIALAMDCLAVSITSGIITGKSWPVAIRLSTLFGLFQTLMPFLGWLLFGWLAEILAAYAHWVAFFMLAFIGGRMIVDSFRTVAKPLFDPSRPATQVLLAIATSIDAFAVGISFAMLGSRTAASIMPSLLMIGLMSLLFGLLGYHLGASFSNNIRPRIKPELLGGIVLMLIGVKVLLSHFL